MTSMNFNSKKVGDAVLVELLISRATINVTGEFKVYVSDIISRGENKIILELSKCKFVDSTFLGTLVRLLKSCVANNGDIKIIGLQSSVKAMFDLTRMDRVFEIHENIDNALKSF